MVTRSKCKHGTKLTEFVRLLSPAAEALLLQGGKKSSPLLKQAIKATTCTTTKGDRVVVKATVVRKNLGGAVREVVGARGGAFPRAQPKHQLVKGFSLPPAAAPGYNAWKPGTWDRGPIEVNDSDLVDGPQPTGMNGLGLLNGPFYVHYGSASHGPMSTVSFATKWEAMAAVRRSKAEGFPARLG